LPELLPEVTLLGFVRDDQIAESYLKDNSSAKIAQWFSTYVDERILICDWLGLKIEKQNLM